jgi:hypothetical protein
MIGRVFVLIAVCATLLSCGDKETPEQRVGRLRSLHEIFPAGVTTIRAEGEEPTLLIDVQVANQGTDPLAQLTVLVRVRGGDGQEKLSQRVTLDLADVRPGIGVRRTAKVPGYELADDDEVFVEIEANLSPEDVRSLPEFAEMESTN